ncbi:MAG: FAD-dependent monooxygenase [Actinomycetaceae bacterium]|nr:FAD-dependent monooxygenase [Actinomycetaceae bacterium]
MQFHHNGYISEDPRVKPASGVGLNPPTKLPDNVDVLVVGSGPAGVATAAQLSVFSEYTTALIEARDSRLILGHADGIAKRSVEMFQAFGFAEEIIAEGYEITETSFWQDDPNNPGNIVRYDRSNDDPDKLSEFPHICVNAARVADYFIRFMERQASRTKPFYGVEFVTLEVGAGSDEYPVQVKVIDNGVERTINAKYVVGCDGARSRVRDCIGAGRSKVVSDHAWGVADVLVNTDFPDKMIKSVIHSAEGSILHIPREGGYMFRTYVDLGDLEAGDDSGEIRNTPLQVVLDKMNAILHPYKVDVKEVCWWSIYEVAHRVTDRFDDVPELERGIREPRVFIEGDACHTHSAKGGQGLNFSIQDAFNLGWKISQVLRGLSSPKILETYTVERQPIAQDLIDNDLEWAKRMAHAEEAGEESVKGFYSRLEEMRAGFATQYPPALLINGKADQSLATNVPLGKRYKSEEVIRRADANKVHLGHLHEADGRWRIYVFADSPKAGEVSKVAQWANWMATNPESPIVKTRRGGDINSVFDTKVIYQQGHREFEMTDVPELFKPVVGTSRLEDWNNVFAAGVTPGFNAAVEESIFDIQGISKDGAVVLVRPDMYVADIQPLDKPEALAEFLNPIFDACCCNCSCHKR